MDVKSVNPVDIADVDKKLLISQYKKKKANFKFNNGMGALLCSECNVIIKTGHEFTEDEWKALRGEIKLPPQYCSRCHAIHVMY